MFYQEERIQSHLKCKICHNMFDDPRIMPCSHSFCHECILDIKDAKSNSSTCPECKVSSIYPPNGFQPCLALANLVAEKPNQVSQSRTIKELRNLLQSLLNKHDTLSGRLIKGSDEIREQCQSLRNQVDVEIESRIEEIHQQGTELKKQINKYEDGCLKLYDAIAEITNDVIKPTLTNAMSFYTNTFQILTEFEIDEDRVTALIVESKSYIDQVANDDDFLLNRILNGHMKFVRNEIKLDSEFIGTLQHVQSTNMNQFSPFL